MVIPPLPVPLAKATLPVVEVMAPPEPKVTASAPLVPFPVMLTPPVVPAIVPLFVNDGVVIATPVPLTLPY